MKMIPVILFAYARPAHLARVLACLRENRVPLILAYADGAKGAADAAAVAEVRALLRTVDWCELRLVERRENLGLGRNVLTGVAEVVSTHEAFVVWEDDLICVPGTYDWMCAALRYYAGDCRVMSITGWTHPRVTPPGVQSLPYFDGRGEGWVWGTWSRCLPGMHEPALAKQNAVLSIGVPADAYGSDLPEMAAVEVRKNIWAVRWYYHHLQHGGLCIRPPWSMVNHIGVDDSATNAGGATEWSHRELRAAPPIPDIWPEPQLNPDCGPLWRKAFPALWKRRLIALVRKMGMHHMA